MAESSTGVAVESVKDSNRIDTVPRIADLFRVPGRYLRSIHLERDFDDIDSLRHYITTPTMVAIFTRIIEGLRSGSGRRAWRITGDYGTGKSSFALMLAHLLRDPSSPGIARVRENIEREIAQDLLGEAAVPLVPVLVTGAREKIVPSVARAIGLTLERLRGRSRSQRGLGALRSYASEVEAAGDASQLLELLDRLGVYAARSGRSGVLLVLDELGKFLEYSALYPDSEDLYVLQQLGEAAARSGDRPLVVLGLLHQGFHAYAERLPSVARVEWEKVAARYEEITFDQPQAHVAALVAGALNVDKQMVPEEIVVAAGDVQAATLGTGWYGTLGSTSVPLTPLELYPLHPTVLPVLVRFFARFGQHERSLFSFLLSSEPFGLQSFAERSPNRKTWYRPANFFDYARSVFGHRLAGASYRNHWLRILGTLDGATEVDALELDVLKTVAILNVLDAEHLLATDPVLGAAIADGDSNEAVAGAIVSLKNRGLLYHRGAAGGYCLWPSTSVSLESAFETAQHVLGPMERVSAQLVPFLDQRPVLARRHYIETGTLRHFEVRYATPEALLDIAAQSTDADGLIVVTLCESLSECRAAVATARTAELASRHEVIVSVPAPLQGLASEVRDACCWQWVADNTPELAHDSYAASEVARQVASSRRALQRRLAALFGSQGEDTGEVNWWHGGKRLGLSTRGRLSAALSAICDDLYREAPLIHNELLNRRVLSSAASAARLRLIEHMFSAADEPLLGIQPGKAPPEKSMYLSVLSAGKIHREEANRFILGEPPEGDDPLRLRPALAQILTLLEQGNGHRVAVTRIFDVLQSRPYGVRAGVAPLLLAIVAVARAHEVAVYEHGTYLPRFDSADFLRLIKQPEAFEFQLCRVVGVRAEVFTLLARVFAEERPTDRSPELLDVVRPLSTFAAQLPEYTRRNSGLPEPAKSVRDALLTAREPGTLVFTALPFACGLEPFPSDGPANTKGALRFVAALRDAMADLRATYPQLLERIRDRVMTGLAASGTRPDRSQVSQRASIVLLAVREPRLQTFARCLADTALSDDSWAEKVGSFVVSKPPARWTVTDEASALDEIDVLAATFTRVETTAFADEGEDPNLTAIRLGLTNGDGSEVARVVRIRGEDETAVQELAARIEHVLAEARDLKLAAISRVLWSHLSGDTPSPTRAPAAETPPTGDSIGGVT